MSAPTPGEYRGSPRTHRTVPLPASRDRGRVSRLLAPYLNLSVRDLLYQTGAGSRRVGYPIGFLIAATVLRASDVAPGCARARADAVRWLERTAEISAGADARRRVNRCVALGGDRRGISTDP